MARRKIIAGNWKMNKTASEAVTLVAEIKVAMAECGDAADVVVCPPATDLKDAASAIGDSTIGLGAQNMHWEESGAFTGEISAEMLKDLDAGYVILGHSERRSYFGETDQIVNKKTKAALAAGLIPIVCVGETLEEREAEKTFEVVGGQVRESMAGLGDALAGVVVAYEPIWAIGTGLTASPQQAQDVHAMIRSVLAEMGGSEIAETIRIQYGGSMKPANAVELLSQPDIDGGLIGGAALEADSFVGIVRAAQ